MTQYSARQPSASVCLHATRKNHNIINEHGSRLPICAYDELLTGRWSHLIVCPFPAVVVAVSGGRDIRRLMNIHGHTNFPNGNKCVRYVFDEDYYRAQCRQCVGPACLYGLRPRPLIAQFTTPQKTFNELVLVLFHCLPQQRAHKTHEQQSPNEAQH